MILDHYDSQEHATSRLGKVINGAWRLESLVAIGGTSWVYAAESPWGGKVVVKVLHSALALEDSVVARFIREAKIVNQIRHDGVVPIDDDGIMENGVPFLVMALLEGETLEERLARKGGKLPLPEVLWIGDQVLDILTDTHKAGIIHRDIKPGNIFLTSDGKVKLLDFGVALMKEAAWMRLTQNGTLLGSVDYMPPEQARGETDKVGVRADLWAVGATMFRLLSGRSVHCSHSGRGEGRVMERLRASMTESAPRLRDVVPDVPESIGLTVDYALAFDAPHRWPTAIAMRKGLAVASSDGLFEDGLLVDGRSSYSRSISSDSLVIMPPRAPKNSSRRPPRI
ncbi:MAG: serine/threonine protein kinase [Polyangiaceae bacterium]|nr:serine/threonine protein kinase [Polyangiaceae bacterium]